MDLRELPSRLVKRHPWEVVRADFFGHLVREHLRGQGLRVLDVGAGDGYFAERLVTISADIACMTCFDTGYEAAWLEANKARHPRLAFTAKKPDGSHDLVVLLDVLEHVRVEESCSVLADVAHNLLVPGGLALVSVPAWQALFSSHDVLLGHQRRFAPAELRALVNEAGLTIVQHGQLFSSLLAPRALSKLGELVRGGSVTNAPPSASIETSLGSWHHGSVVTALTTLALSLDAASARLAARIGLPFIGLSTWVLARRP